MVDRKFSSCTSTFNPGDTVAFKEIEEAVKSLHGDGLAFGDVRLPDILTECDKSGLDRSDKASEVR